MSSTMAVHYAIDDNVKLSSFISVLKKLLKDQYVESSQSHEFFN